MRIRTAAADARARLEGAAGEEEDRLASNSRTDDSHSRRFEIHQPASAREASQMLAHYDDEAGIYAGGTELLLAMKHRRFELRHLIDLKVVPGLNSIELRTAHLEIGAHVHTSEH